MVDEERIERILKTANIQYFKCPKHGIRIGYFYTCDECNRKLYEGDDNEKVK